MQSDICKLLGLNIERTAYEAVRTEFGLSDRIYDYESKWYKDMLGETN
jgi:hypothetical protein